MAEEKRRINIMSSCDENYAKLVPVQLLSIADNLLTSQLDYEVHYYLFYYRVSDETVDRLRSYCETLRIFFHKVQITDIEPYMELASKGGIWVYEAYFSVECHRYLPPEVDRILYIDAADVLILGDIGEFYYADFEDHLIIATSICYKPKGDSDWIKMESDDLGDEIERLKILRGVFNSGSYVINVERMRLMNSSINDFIALKRALEDIYPDNDPIYFGDQGLLAAALVGDIKYFRYPEIKNLWYQPYNFCVWFFDRATEICGGNPWYIPRILHFAGGIKPWELTSENEKTLKPGQWPFYKIYELYANQVPISLRPNP
jgi:lipopolysaccharide biosynthesis glycosyltransferase